MNIHQTAIVSDKAKIASDVEVGAYSIIGDNVEIGSGCKIKSHVCISGNTKIGSNNVFFPFSVIGEAPQDLKFSGELSHLEIGDNNIFREHVTVHTGTVQGNPYFKDKNLTKIGSNCLFMVGSHIAHDCFIGDKVILANNATLAGHVTVSNNVIVGGLSAVQQFVRIGDHAIIGGMSGVENDVVPYAMIIGERASLVGLNITGLKRRKFSKEQIKNLKDAYDEIFFNEEGMLKDRVENVAKQYTGLEVKLLTDFLLLDRHKAVCKPKKK